MRIVLFVLFPFLFLDLSAKKPFFLKDELAAQVRWKLVYSDEFCRKSSIDKSWVAEDNKVYSHILCSRWRENVEVKRGKLFIINKKENKQGKDWTSGSISTKQTFQYGYYECRMKISAASGTNNSFWLYQWNATEKLPSFEIDIVESHYPNEISSNVHNKGVLGVKKTQTVSNDFYSEENLSEDYHIYGLWWTRNELSFYFDGQKIWSTPNNSCFQDAHLVVGAAIVSWAGEVTNQINGTSMIVDYVRVWYER